MYQVPEPVVEMVMPKYSSMGCLNQKLVYVTSLGKQTEGTGRNHCMLFSMLSNSMGPGKVKKQCVCRLGPGIGQELPQARVLSWLGTARGKDFMATVHAPGIQVM